MQTIVNLNKRRVYHITLYLAIDGRRLVVHSLCLFPGNTSLVVHLTSSAQGETRQILQPQSNQVSNPAQSAQLLGAQTTQTVQILRKLQLGMLAKSFLTRVTHFRPPSSLPLRTASWPAPPAGSEPSPAGRVGRYQAPRNPEAAPPHTFHSQGALVCL